MTTLNCRFRKQANMLILISSKGTVDDIFLGRREPILLTTDDSITQRVEIFKEGDYIYLHKGIQPLSNYWRIDFDNFKYRTYSPYDDSTAPLYVPDCELEDLTVNGVITFFNNQKK